MKKLIRILGQNGVIYEEPMTEGQLQQFLKLATLETSLGVAFDEWSIEIIDATVGQQRIKEKEPLFLCASSLSASTPLR